MHQHGDGVPEGHIQRLLHLARKGDAAGSARVMQDELDTERLLSDRLATKLFLTHNRDAQGHVSWADLCCDLQHWVTLKQGAYNGILSVALGDAADRPEKRRGARPKVFALRKSTVVVPILESVDALPLAETQTIAESTVVRKGGDAGTDCVMQEELHTERLLSDRLATKLFLTHKRDPEGHVSWDDLCLDLQHWVTQKKAEYKGTLSPSLGGAAHRPEMRRGARPKVFARRK